MNQTTNTTLLALSRSHRRVGTALVAFVFALLFFTSAAPHQHGVRSASSFSTTSSRRTLLAGHADCALCNWLVVPGTVGTPPFHADLERIQQAIRPIAVSETDAPGTRSAVRRVRPRAPPARV